MHACLSVMLHICLTVRAYFVLDTALDLVVKTPYCLFFVLDIVYLLNPSYTKCRIDCPYPFSSFLLLVQLKYF